MGKKLIIAEKPSVAQDIARALGGFHKEKDYWESEQYVLSSAVGHLLELKAPEEYEVKRGKWSFANLPVIPPRFELQPIAKSEDRLKLLLRLAKRKDVDGLINACDAGREGELIFNYIVQYGKIDKPVQRLWLQSMTPQAIREAFAHLRSAEEMEGLRQAAVSRAESDWLIGINGTRAMTAFNSKSGGFHLTTVGRVQTPTLAMVVERERQIRAFRPRPYWEVEATFRAAAGTYTGRWFDEKFKSPRATSTPAPTVCGSGSAPKPSAIASWTSRVWLRKPPSPARRSPRRSSTSPACSARRMPASASPRATRSPSPRRSTSGTKRSPIPVPDAPGARQRT